MSDKRFIQSMGIGASYCLVMSLLFGVTWWVIASTVVLVVFWVSRKAYNLDDVKSDSIDGQSALIIIKAGLDRHDRIKSNVIAPALKRTEAFLKNNEFTKRESFLFSGEHRLPREEYSSFKDNLNAQNWKSLSVSSIQKVLDVSTDLGLPRSLEKFHTLSPKRHCLFWTRLEWNRQYPCNQIIALEFNFYFSNAFKDNSLSFIHASQKRFVHPERLAKLLCEIEKTYGNHTDRPSLIHAFNRDNLDVFNYLRDRGVSFDDVRDWEILNKIEKCYDWSTISEWSGELNSLDESVLERVAGEKLRETIRTNKLGLLPV